jgi:hypothetical protein
LRYVPGNKHTVADGLSRRPRTESNDLDERNEEDIEVFLDSELAILSIAPVKLSPEASENSDSDTPIKVLNKDYLEES